MDASEDITSQLESLQSKMEDLEIRVGQVLSKQLQTMEELEKIHESPNDKEDPVEDEQTELNLPDNYHFTEELKSVLEGMVDTQKAWMDSVEASKKVKTQLKGPKIFDQMQNHLSERLEYLEMAKTILEGPLLEELPPPPPPPPPEEEAPVEEKKAEEKGKKSKGKKSKKKK